MFDSIRNMILLKIQHFSTYKHQTLTPFPSYLIPFFLMHEGKDYSCCQYSIYFSKSRVKVAVLSKLSLNLLQFFFLRLLIPFIGLDHSKTLLFDFFFSQPLQMQIAFSLYSTQVFCFLCYFSHSFCQYSHSFASLSAIPAIQVFFYISLLRLHLLGFILFISIPVFFGVLFSRPPKVIKQSIKNKNPIMSFVKLKNLDVEFLSFYEPDYE